MHHSHPSDPSRDHQHRAQHHLTRRSLFGRTSLGLGSLALSNLLAPSSYAHPPFPDSLPHFPPKAKRVIYLLMNGAPPHIDMFDYKPELERWRGKEIPESIHQNQRVSTMTQGATKLVLPAFTGFRRYGESGQWVCDFLPHTAKIVDDLCFIKSLHTSAVNHAPAITYFLTGSEMPGRPSMGSWLTYGLGSECENLPGFVVMTSRDKEATCGQIFYDFYWSSGFLPSRYQGVKFRGGASPVLYVNNPPGIDDPTRRIQLDALATMNQWHHADFLDPEIETRMSQYEMAYQMQASVPDLVDLSDESPQSLALYGPDATKQGTYAYNCLMARRLIERGVRFVQLFHAGWDHHRNLSTQFEIQCRDTDQPSAGLVQDLKQRGLLDDTLVIWGGEFGRTPFIQGNIDKREQWGRDHHPYAFTMWMAGAGVKNGFSYGESDPFGFNVAQNPVHVHDFQATILHLLGIDHERFTYRAQGRQYRLTDIHGHVVNDILS